jgi:hypothetical protein
MLEIHSDARTQAAKEHPARLQDTPQLGEHFSKVIFIAGEVKYGAAYHDIGECGWEGHLLDDSNLKILDGKSGFQRCGEIANMLDSIAVRIQSKDLAALPKQMNQIAAIPASCIHHAHPRGDVPAKDLIENVDVNLSKLFLKTHRHSFTILPQAAPVSIVNRAARAVTVLEKEK